VARILPTAWKPREGPGGAAEAAVVAALREQLDDEWLLVPGLAYLDGERASEGEADVVALHGAHGLLVIEVKGSGVRWTAAKGWQRQRGSAWEAMGQSPAQQAQRTVKQLIGQLRRSDPRWGDLVHGHAVAFPYGALDPGAFTLDMPARIVLHHGGLAGWGGQVADVLGFYRGRIRARELPPIARAELDVLVRRDLLPELHVVASLANALDHEERAFVALTTSQRQVVAAARRNRRLRVVGPAGSGKTLAALHLARSLAQEGAHVRLLCFNRALGQRLQAEIAAAPPSAGAVEAEHFHALADRAWRGCGRAIEPPTDPVARSRYWTSTVPQGLLEALERGALDRVDAAVIDEAQDFHPSWWPLVDALLRDGAAGRLVCFEDPGQRLFVAADTAPAPEMSELPLLENLRNTRSICAAIRPLSALDIEPAWGVPPGEPPTAFPRRSAFADRRELEDLVTRLTTRDGVRPEQITILTPHTRERSCLAGVERLAGFELARDPLDRGGRLLHATIGQFKGLESDVVCLMDLGDGDPRSDRAARYVAASRARMRLFVWSDDARL
jgi:DNA polymerase III delta prime subunit